MPSCIMIPFGQLRKECHRAVWLCRRQKYNFVSKRRMRFSNVSSYTVVVPQIRHRKSSSWGYAGLALGVLVLMIYVPYASAVILRVPHSYGTIQAGIAAASAGDTVSVAPGVYFENVTMKPGVHIHGEPGAILDGSQGAGAVVSAASGMSVLQCSPVLWCAVVGKLVFS